MTWATAWALAQAWYEGRLDPAWRRPPVEQIESLFSSLGLTSTFWQLR